MIALLCGFVFHVAATAGEAEKVTIAAASDLKFAMEDVLAEFRKTQPACTVEAVYGSSGQFHTQITQGAPFDLFFSADISFPRMLAEKGLAGSDVKPYAVGRIVLWSVVKDASKMTLADLADPSVTRIAIANPKHAPYGQRAEEALRASGMWEKIESKLVFGDNIAHTAQLVESKNAQVGIIALSLAKSPTLAKQGGYAPIDESLHNPLEQGFVVTKRAEKNACAAKVAAFMGEKSARDIMVRYGFALPGESAAK
ncbi:MAG: molybdate ABC transporter substrate-binding protein [Deltaproteobacteria bacterium]|nr:molybdate ABC transporter substrate-binding protein [Deltaproteobacteria bacterium]